MVIYDKVRKTNVELDRHLKELSEVSNPIKDAMVQVVTVPCPSCGKQSTVSMTVDQYTTLTDPGSPHIQKIFPDWTSDQRELLISGTHPECWDKMFADTDEEDV